MYDEKDSIVYDLAKIHSSKIISPNQVDKFDESLQSAIGQKTKLIVQSTIAVDI